MRVEQHRWTDVTGWQPAAPGAPLRDAHLVLVFGATDVLRGPRPLQDVLEAYPGATVLGCSTAGEIWDTQVLDRSLVVTAIRFDHTRVRGVERDLEGDGSSFAAGQALAAALADDDLVHALVISDGLRVNGSELVQGLSSALPDGVAVTGGLAGDGDRFHRTCVFMRNAPKAGRVAAVGFYGKRLRIGYASLGGWDPFGPDRLITRSDGNVLYELDGHSALGLYKRYLGTHAAGLPASGLLFPLSLRTPEGAAGVVRTILSVDEEAQSMTFAGDVPTGSYARFMKANFERLIDGAMSAARASGEPLEGAPSELALLISCVGRKMVLRQRIEEEVEGVRDVLGRGPALTGFYSYGEISPFTPHARCELHNQTMTITTLSER